MLLGSHQLFGTPCPLSTLALSCDFYKTINGIPILYIISQKTDTPAKIPFNISPWLIPILEKYNYSSPKMSIQKFNAVIKDIFHKAKTDG